MNRVFAFAAIAMGLACTEVQSPTSAVNGARKNTVERSDFFVRGETYGPNNEVLYLSSSRQSCSYNWAYIWGNPQNAPPTKDSLLLHQECGGQALGTGGWGGPYNGGQITTFALLENNSTQIGSPIAADLTQQAGIISSPSNTGRRLEAMPFEGFYFSHWIVTEQSSAETIIYSNPLVRSVGVQDQGYVAIFHAIRNYCSYCL